MNASSMPIGKLGRAAVLLLACALAGVQFAAPAPALAATIENTATVSHGTAGGSGLVVLRSNTVYTPILPAPTGATIEFRTHAPGAPGSIDLPIGGTQCRMSDGSFQAPSPVPDIDGNPLDLADAETTGTQGYYDGEPIVISVADANRNADPAVREYIEVDVTASTGDAETLRLQETGPDSGVFAGVIQSVAIPPEASHHDCVLSIAEGAEIVARYVDPDFPGDEVSTTAVGYGHAGLEAVLRLEQSVSRQVVEIGDFLQYTLVLRNTHDAPAIAARIRNTLPPGLRMRQGSLRISAAASEGSMGAPVPAADPGFDAGGRTFEFAVGDLAVGDVVTATFVAEVGAGAKGPFLLNLAVANANGGLVSNDTDTVVRMHEAMLTSRFTIIGRVLAGDCEAGAGGQAGVGNVRVLLDDGTYTSTDPDGSFHFAGVRPGTHVVQLDVATLPPGLEVAPCRQNTRSAGRGYSQFVEAQGGTLWRADFHLRQKAAEVSDVGVRLQASRDGDRTRFAVELDGGAVDVSRLRALMVLPEGFAHVAGSATVGGEPVADPQVTDNIATFDLGAPGARWQRLLQFDVAGEACPSGGVHAKAIALLDAGGKTGLRTPPAEVALACEAPPGTAATSKRTSTQVTAAAADPAASPFAEQQENRRAIVGDVEAGGGGDVDWFKDQAPGSGWVFPGETYNPRTPSLRVVVKHAPGQTVRLSLNGKVVSALHSDGSDVNAASTIAVSKWSGLDMEDGDNALRAEILAGDGSVVATLQRSVHYANYPVRAELVPGESILVADGIHSPVIAVRMLDNGGHPVRAGVSGEFSLSPPYLPAQTVQMMQARQLSGMDGAPSTWRIEGDDGIAYIDLQPTTVSGNVMLGFEFLGKDQLKSSRQELQAWLKSAPRDWIVVGFAAGSIGYATLKDNMQALEQGEEGHGVRGDGQVSLYAKGRVMGKWMLTLAYDSDKPTERLQREGLLSTIDPQQYYTLYGDGTAQGYDAASVEKVYLKLEHDQFYALFGDFQTGLDRNELSRYQRTLNGLKVEYRGPLFEFNGFAARTSQAFARDEIPGDGTSGLYRLSRSGILMNSERVRIETRDRFHSEQIVETRELARHIDYDIDYDNGTLFFREPIASRDFDFNPNFIVVEYETRGGSDKHLNAGGRAGVRLLDDRLEAGVSYLRDEDAHGRSRLVGVDARFRLTPRDELRGEAATTSSDNGVDEASGNAWLLEWEHRGERFDLLAYARRQGLGYGLGQQNRSESGMAKLGAQGQWRLSERFSLQGEAYRLENLASGAVREAANLEVVYRDEDWGTRAGLQWARDEGADGEVAESRQVTLAANRFFFDRKLELRAQADLSLGGANDSVDFPTRFEVGAAYAITPAFRLIAAHEITDGEDRDTSTTRLGFETTPWANARLTSTLNQSQITEYGPRTFALFGLNQKFMVGERWALDVSLDSSHAFNESGEAPLVVDPAQPIAAGGIRDGGALTEDFVALSGGATYRTELWSWNSRMEGRKGDEDERYGFTTAFLRQARDGVALSASLQAFAQHNADGSSGLLASAQLGWAYRPLGSRWSMLDKLEFRVDKVTGGAGAAIFGQDTLAATGNASSRRLVNNFVLNYQSDAWEAEVGTGNVFALNQRSQLSLYYGSKYVLDSFGGEDYAGYTDLVGVEWRYDLGPKLDIGIRSSVLHSWSQKTFAWAIGPSVGFSPFTNTWISVGYNFKGFHDRDFEQSHFTAEGAYIMLRLKFDQDTFGLDRAVAPGH